MLSYGCVMPLAFFIPGTFITMAQGIAMPYGQVGAMAEIPRFAGTAAGVGVFMQNFGAAIFAQLYGILADGTPRPMIMIAVLCGCPDPDHRARSRFCRRGTGRSRRRGSRRHSSLMPARLMMSP